MATIVARQASFTEILKSFTRIGLTSFGGPAGQIALMHRELVEERGWISEEDFLHALNFCHLLPGPEAQQLATWIGWRLHGWKGGLAAGLLFVIPGAVVILALSALYAVAAQLSWLQALFLFDLPFPLVVLGAGAIGLAAAALRPDWLALKAAGAAPLNGPKPWRTTLAAVVICGTAWAAPMILIALTLGQDHVLWDIGAFFSQLALVTFGGAYVVLAYMAQEAVQVLVPAWSSFDWRGGALAAVAGVLAFRLGWSVMRVLAVAALGGLALGMVWGPPGA